MAVHKDFRAWCSHCYWNILPHIPEVKEGFLARRYDDFGKKHGRSLYKSLAEAPEDALRPRLNVSKVCATAVALCIYLISLLMAVFGVFLISWDWPNLVTIIAGAAFLGIFWMVRPRLSEMPTGGVSEQEFPALFQLVNRICDHIGIPHVSTIIVDEDFNAGFAQFGWRRESVMWIGLPLWTILTPGERVAILSHEASHGANGDPTRSLIVQGALNTLEGWLYFLRPNYDYRAAEYTDTSFGEVLAYYLMWIFSFLVEGVMHILRLLVWRDSQIAEYLADYLATTVAGTGPMIRGLKKLAYWQFFEHVKQTSVFSRSQSGRELMDRFGDFIAALPEHEVERLRLINKMKWSRLDSTHPPTAYRIEFLKNHIQGKRKILLTPEERKALDKEMESLKEAIGKKLINQILAYR